MEKNTDSKLETVGSSSSTSHRPDQLAGLISPTEEEMDTLRHIPDKINWSAYFVNFIQQPLPKGSKTGAGGKNRVSGALGQGQQISTGLTTFFQLWTFMTPLLCAYIADEKLGRFNTIAVSVAIALVGYILLLISSIPPAILHPNGALSALCVAVVVLGLGTGGLMGNIPILVAEQQHHLRPFISHTKSGERVIVNPTLTTSRIYMYFYFFTNVGAMVGQVSMTVTEKYDGFYLAFIIPTVVFLLCPIVLFFGRNMYRRYPPQGSVLAKSIKGRWSLNPIFLYKIFKAKDFWESAKPSNIPDSQRLVWMTFDDKWVEEVRRGLKPCTVFIWYPLQCNNLTSQVATTAFQMMCGPTTSSYLIILGGDFVSTCKDANRNPITSSLSVWIQSGSYILIALSENFANMKSLVVAIFFSTSAISAAISEALNRLSTDPRLVWNYGTMAVLSGIGGILFLDLNSKGQ
ncbi:hypothetical protein BGW80DRAFT_1436627 [Lactifluus volemus]|nr:hypothetical protein BGW80DRAFT_1436627 [Lactifluus volemus]